MKIRRNKESGFSLVGVIMGASVASFVGLSIAQLMHSQMQSANFIEDKLAKIDLRGQLLSKLSNEDSCRNTFANLNIVNEQSISSIKNEDNSDYFDLNVATKNQFDNLKLSSIQLVNDNVSPGANQSGDMKVQFFPQRTRGNPIDMAPFDFTINVTTNALGRIGNCKAYGEGGGSSGLDNSARECQSAPGGQQIFSHQAPAKNKNGNYDEGSSYVYSCSDFGPAQVYACINGSWRNLSAGKCTNKN